MSLTNDPQFTPDPNGVGGLYGGATGSTVGANNSVSTTFGFGVGNANGATSGYASACLLGRLQLSVFGGGTVNTTNGVSWQLFSSSSGNSGYDTVAYITGPTTGAVVNSTTASSIDIPPGFYTAKLSNTDPANNVKAALTLGTLG